MPSLDAGACQHFLEVRRLAAILAEQAKGRIEPRLDLDRAIGGRGPRFFGSRKAASVLR